MRQTAKDGLKLRKVFRDLNSHVASVEVNGDDIEVMIRPDQDEMCLMIPFNEDGEKVAVTVTPSVVKRWHREAQEARSFMRRVISRHKVSGACGLWPNTVGQFPEMNGNRFAKIGDW